MKAEAWVFGSMVIFFVIVTPIYWFASYDPTGTSALVLTVLLAALITFYLGYTARHMDPRPEDRKDAEISDGAGEVGFFSPHSWWPLALGLSLMVCVYGVVFGWWLFIIGVGTGVVSLCGFIFEYYRGEHAH
ncbi:MAG TPA: cytochrome c oxidase subunit 4 [Nocardioidaceae bacterium]|nr:cytochrome c oxidase subunit 4 [Nocardioidaceae bacterium]